MSEIESLSFQILKNKDVPLHAKTELLSSKLYDERGAVSELGPLDGSLGVDSQYEQCKICDLKGGQCIGHEGYINLSLPVIHPGLRNLFKQFMKGVCIPCGRYTLKKNCPTCDKSLKYTFSTPYIIRETSSSKIINIKDLHSAFKRIPPTDYCLLFGNSTMTPEDLFLERLIMPARTVRPNLRFNNKCMIDDLTRKMSSIILLNQTISKHLQTGDFDLITEEVYFLMCYEIFTYMDNKLTNIPVSSISGGKPVKSLLERLESKEGLPRANLRGKRTNYAARCVLTPDSALNLSEVGISKLLAQSLTKPVMVTKHNIEQVKKWISSTEYVSANYYDCVMESGEKSTLKISDLNRQVILERLKLGDVVHRHLMTGDYVVVCRAPVIHRYGLMGHRVVVYENTIKGKDEYTIKLNPTICLPYNADFDGDEVHIHSPQTQSAQIDVQLFMDVNKNYRDSKGGYPIVGLQKELVTSAYYMSKNNPTLTRSVAISLLGDFFDPIEQKSQYSGRELISMCLPKSFNFNDQNILIEDGQFKKGTLTKSACSRTSVLSKRLMVFAGAEYKEIFRRLERLFRNYYKYLDHSVSVFDYLSNEEVSQKLSELKEHYANKIEKDPSIVHKASKEFQLKAYNLLQSEVTKSSNENNPAIMMGSAGSSGTLLNLNQMRSCIGTRLVRGVSPAEYFKGLYPHYTGSVTKSKLYNEGLIWGNYSTGLNYLDFLNDAIHARDANITNQLKITNMGYFCRRLLSALSDLYVDKDNKIVDGKGRIIQHRFGGSGVNLEDYTTQGEEPQFSVLLKTNHFNSLKEPQTITRDNLLEYIKDKGYDSKIAKIILCNSEKNRKYAPSEVDNICNYLLIPIGSPIGISTGHAISEPSVQLTLSSKHKLTGSQTTLERLVNLIDRSMVAPQIHLTANTQKGLDTLSNLRPVYLPEKYKVTIDVNDRTVKIAESEVSDHLYTKLIDHVKSKGFLLDSNSYSISRGAQTVITIDSSVPFKAFYYLSKCIKSMLISGSQVIKNYVMEDKKLMVEGAKNTIQLYKYIDQLNKKGVLEGVNIQYLDPVYLQQRKGIEAARKLLYLQLVKFLEEGIHIDPRYFSLFSDLMSYNGSLNALNRSGVMKMKSALTRASFEATKTTIYNLALTNEKDTLKSPISSVIIGKTPPIGSNKFSIDY